MPQASHFVHSWALLELASLLDQPVAAIAAVAAKVVVPAHSEAHDDVEVVKASASQAAAETAVEVLAEESWEGQTTASDAPCVSAYEGEAVGEGIDDWEAY